MGETRLILANNRVIEGGTAGQADGRLWLTFTGYTMRQAADMMLDPAKTKKIRFQFGEMEEEYAGYTECTALSMSGGEISVCLTKGGQ